MQFFSLRIAVSFSFSPAPPFQWGGSIEEGVLMERSQARQIRDKGGWREREYCGMNCSFVVTGVSLMLSKADRAHP